MNKIINFYNKHTEVKWVLFDYFDTVVHRKCNPQDIKNLGKKIAFENPLLLISSTIYKIRIEAEAYLAQKDKSNGEFTYKELCDEIYNRFFYLDDADRIINGNTQEEFCLKCLELEMRIENDMQYVDDVAVDAIKYIKACGKKVGIVSDFYLSGVEIKEILFNKGILPYVDDVFVSCDWKCNKNKGELYKKVLEHLNIQSVQCVMVGDNKRSDYYRAKKNGIVPLFNKNKHLVRIIDKMEIIRRMNQIEGVNRRGANNYFNYAYSLLLFTKKLYDAMRDSGFSNVYFFSREGEILKKLFDIYQDISGNRKIDSHYIYVSRLSTYVPTLKEICKEKFSILFRQYKDLSLSSFLLSIGFVESEIDSIAKKLKYNKNDIICDFEHSAVFAEIKNNDVFLSIYETRRLVQRHNFLSYLEQAGIRRMNGKIAVVDVGWRGTIQDNIFCLFQDELHIEGFYFGILDKGICSLHNKKHGIVFSELPIKSSLFDIWNFDHTFLERLLFASHPATIGYCKEDSLYKPIYKEFDSEINTYQLIKPVQDGVITTFKMICRLFNDSGYLPTEFEKEFALIHLKTVLLIDSNNMKLQRTLLNNQFENFGYNFSNKELTKDKFAIKNIWEKKELLIHKPKIKDLELISRILINKKIYFFVKLIYSFLFVIIRRKIY